MQTIYYETSSFIRHEGNVVDLDVYRQKLSAVSGGDWAPESVPAEGETPADLVALPAGPAAAAQERERRRKVRRAGMVLDFAASAAIIVLTLTAVVQFIRL